MKFNPEDMVVSFGDQTIESFTEVTGIELDMEEFIETTLTLNGEDFHIKIKRGDLDKIIDNYGEQVQ